MWIIVEELFKAAIFSVFGVISITLILLGFKILKTPKQVYEAERRRLKEQRRKEKEIMDIFRDKT